MKHDFCLSLFSYYSHNNDYLEICRCYKSIYEIPSIKEDPSKWIPVKLSHSQVLLGVVCAHTHSRYNGYLTAWIRFRFLERSVGIWCWRLMIRCNQAFSMPHSKTKISLRYQISGTLCCFQDYKLSWFLMFFLIPTFAVWMGIGYCWSNL